MCLCQAPLSLSLSVHLCVFLFSRSLSTFFFYVSLYLCLSLTLSVSLFVSLSFSWEPVLLKRKTKQNFTEQRFVWKRAVIVVQLADWSLLTSEVRGLNPNIGKVFRKYLCISVNCNSEKTKIKKKRPGFF